MADAFRFGREKSPQITEPESRSGLRFRDEENLRNTTSWKSSPTFPSQEDVSHFSTGLNEQLEAQAHEVTTEDYDEGEIIASAEKEESPQKIGLIPPREDENSTNFLGEAEKEAGLELIIVPPPCGASMSGSSCSNVSPATQIAVKPSKEFHDSDGSPESISRLSRIDSAKQDMKNLKSATLGRMGKIFKIRPPTPSDREKTSYETEQGVEAESAEQQYGQDPTRKEKTHSLGRMLRLVDKDGAPRKLFSHTRTGSLTRLRKMHSTVDQVAGSTEDSRNIFTRMLNQFRGRNPSATNAEPNLQSANGPGNSPKPSLGTRLMMSLSARGNSTAGPTVGTETAEAAVERVTV